MSNLNNQWLWGIFAIVIVTFILLLGVRSKNGPFAILIDARGKYSLSQFQLFLWTLLITSSFLSVALNYKTMDISIPPELWALMGISLGSSTGAVIIKSNKMSQSPSDTVLAKPGFKEVKRVGLLHSEEASENKNFFDMFFGDEINNFKYIDISKVQMFFFTLAAWVGYSWQIYHAELKVGDGIAFPELSTGVVTLIGISHTGYLAIKSSGSTPVK